MSETTDPQARRVEEIRARCEAATEGPWGYRGPTRDVLAEYDGGAVRERRGMRPAGDTFPLIGKIMSPPDGEFVAHAREDVPFLLSELARLSGEVRRLEEVERAARQYAGSLQRLKNALLAGASTEELLVAELREWEALNAVLTRTAE
jgi:hypothetical protein